MPIPERFEGELELLRRIKDAIKQATRAFPEDTPRRYALERLLIEYNLLDVLPEVEPNT